MANGDQSGPDRSAWIFRGGAILSGLGLVVSYLLAWAEVVGLTRERGSGPDEIPIGADALLRQQGFQDNTGATIPGTEITTFPEVVAVLGVVVVIVAALRWRLATQAVVSFCGLVAAMIGLFFVTFLDSGEQQAIRVGSHEGPAASFEPAVGLWLVVVCGVVVIALGVGGAIYEYRTASPADTTG